MARLKLQDAVAVRNRKYAEVEVPELGGSLRIASLSAARSLQSSELNAAKERGENVDGKLMRLMVGHGVVDDDGNQFFTSDEMLEKFLDRISVESLTIIVNAIGKLMEKTKDEDEAAKVP